jgi:hypothetical protein
MNPWKEYHLGERKFIKIDWIFLISITLDTTVQAGKGAKLTIVIRKVLGLNLDQDTRYTIWGFFMVFLSSSR